MRKRYGLPYQGSKNKLAERIVELLPSADHLYDVFCGGGAVTHCALLSRKWKCVHFSDITDSVVLLKDCFEGNVPDGSEWISREEFFARKDNDPYVRLLWSFGNGQRQYLYSKEIEPYKKLVHEMIYAETPNERRLKFREVCKMIPFILSLNGGDDARDCTQSLTHGGVTLQNIRKLHDIQSSEAYDRMSALCKGRDNEWYRIQTTERHKSLPQPFCAGGYEMRIADYHDIEILPNSIIYADPPYYKTTGYGGKSNKSSFDHELFYEWALSQTQPIFISEYWMPDDFECIAEFERTSSFSATNNAKKEIERIYIPKGQFYKPKENPTQLSLF